jgi:hypothetical protein
MKKPTFRKGGEAVGWAARREAACQRMKETLPKDLGRQPLTVRNEACQRYENIRFYTSDGFPNVKDPYSKALEPDCLSPFACDCDTVSLPKGGVIPPLFF